MKKALALMFFLAFLLSSLQAKQVEASKFEAGVRCAVGSMMTLKSAKANTSEFVMFAVPEAYVEWRPLSSINWLGVEVAGYIGNTNPYLLGDVKEMTLPTITLKGHTNWAYLGLGGQMTSPSGTYEYVSGNVKTKYPSSGGGFGLVVQAGLNFKVYKGFSAGIDLKYTPMSSFNIDFSKTDKAVFSKMFTPAVGVSYSF
jgi:outer membrane protein W